MKTKRGWRWICHKDDADGNTLCRVGSKRSATKEVAKAGAVDHVWESKHYPVMVYFGTKDAVDDGSRMMLHDPKVKP